MAWPCRIRSWRAAGPPCGGKGRLNTHFVGSQKLSVQPPPPPLPELGRQALGAAGPAAPGNLRPPFGPRRRSPRRFRSPCQGPRRPCALACDGPLAVSRAAAVFRPASGSRRARLPLRGLRRNAAPSVPRNLDPAFAGKHLLSPRDIFSALFEILSPHAAWGGGKSRRWRIHAGKRDFARTGAETPRAFAGPPQAAAQKKYFPCPGAFEVRNPESPALHEVAQAPLRLAGRGGGGAGQAVPAARRRSARPFLLAQRCRTAARHRSPPSPRPAAARTPALLA